MDVDKRDQPQKSWTQIEASAPGKFILSGEYSVVFGKHAIAAAIDRRTKVTIKPNHDGIVRLCLRTLKAKIQWPTEVLKLVKLVTEPASCLEYDMNMPSRLNEVVETKREMVQEPEPEMSLSSFEEKTEKTEDASMAFLMLYIGLSDSFASSNRIAIDVEVDSVIPVGSGLGSSSAFSVALCGALMEVFGIKPVRESVSKWAFQIEKFYHGRPSGVDNNVVTNGGYILFQNGNIKASRNVDEDSMRVMLIDTGVSRSTRKLGAVLARERANSSARTDQIFDKIDKITTSIWDVLSGENFQLKEIFPMLDDNQKLLEDLGVGHPKITEIRSIAKEFGFACKLTGAGGGGSAIVLYSCKDDEESVERLKEKYQEAGFKAWCYSVGSDGLSVKVIGDIK